MDELNFDREWRLDELLAGAELESIGPALAGLLGGEAAICDRNGAILWGQLSANARRQPLVLEIEALGHLASATAPEVALAGAARLLEALLRRQVRYRMAASLHQESVTADYEKLQREHARVLDSEARYRKLAAELEDRVAQQVAQLEEQKRQLYQAEKLASVGQLAAGVAHEINNPLGFVRSNLTTLGVYLGKFSELAGALDDVKGAWQRLDLDYVISDGADLLQESQGGVDRIARIVRDLKGFSNVDRPEEEVVDLNECVQDVCAVIDGQLPPGVSLRFDPQPLPRLLCLPGHLNQVFLNVLQNAVRAVEDAGRPGEVAVSTRTGKGTIEVVVHDNGVGMSHEQQERAFDPFFTTRIVGQGTGLGLTVARDIVLAHDGRIKLDSLPGEGTTVTISLPA